MTAAHKKKKRMHKKAPTAPKRGKSPYILFSMERREDIKSRLHPDAGVTEIMKAIATEWSRLTEEEKEPWKAAAEVDKQRYEDEMAAYDGPLRVPNKRAKKHPDAPKRAMSAFLFYAQVMRPRIKAEYPDMRNIDISRRLGEAWARATDEEKSPYMAKERADRSRYRREMEAWNAHKATGFHQQHVYGGYNLTEV